MTNQSTKVCNLEFALMRNLENTMTDKGNQKISRRIDHREINSEPLENEKENILITLKPDKKHRVILSLPNQTIFYD